MATRVLERERPWQWLRVCAWSGSFAAHIGVFLLVAMPVTVTTPLARTVSEPIVWIETTPPPPAIPEPPPPAVPHPVRHKPTHVVSAPVEPPVIPNETVASTPVMPEAPSASQAEAPATDSASSDIGTGGATQMLAYASPLQPRYPPASVRAREQGTVLLRVLVDANGLPQRVEIARSSGHSRLDAAARETVMRGRFRPVMRDGEAGSAWGLVPIEFRLDRG